MKAADHIDWDRAPGYALDARKAQFYGWYPDPMVNTCFNAVDRHVIAGKGEQAAINYDSPLTGQKDTVSYAALRDKTARLASALRAKSITKGDRMIIYMSKVTEAIVAMLTCSRIGAIHSVVFGSFAAHQLAVWIDDAKLKAILVTSCGIEPGRVIA